LKGYEYQEKVPPINGHILESLMAYDWPGNVRELQNTLHRYVTLKRLDFLGAPLREVSHSQDLKFEPIVEKEGILREAVTNFEREYILKKLEMNHWHRTKVAYELGIDRKTLFKKMRNYGIFVPHNGAK
jgi:DNA-binding NtrC family response regulator